MGLKRDTEKSKIIVRYVDNIFSVIEKISREKNHWNIEDLRNSTIYQLDQIDIYRTFHPKTEEYVFFSTVYGTFTKTDHISCLNKFK